MTRADGERPVFIVGVGRSGTTLMRAMLDGHPRLAIAAESLLILRLDDRRGLMRFGRPTSLNDILADEGVRGWGLHPGRIRDHVATVAPRTYPELVSAVFSAWASRRGRARWGQKMPRYVEHIDRLSAMFPGAQFIHMVRDGRDVAASRSERSWGPSSAVVSALQWRRGVSMGHGSGGRLGPDRYLEMRLEDLITDPGEQLRKVCFFLGEDYESAMLDYPERVTWARGSSDHQHLDSAPTPGLRSWRTGLSAREQRGVEAVCRRWLVRLGYPPAPVTPIGLTTAWLASLPWSFDRSRAWLGWQLSPVAGGVRRIRRESDATTAVPPAD